MDCIKIDTGTITIALETDGKRTGEISFCPSDTSFAKRFYGLIQDLEQMSEEYLEKAKQIDDNAAVDDWGLPANVQETNDLYEEVCKKIEEKIDHVFGEGTSQKAFCGRHVLECYAQFLDGLKPCFERARQFRMDKYRK